MTKREKHEIAETVKVILSDKDNQLKNLYVKSNGSLKGFRSYIREECVHFWSDGFNPYLDKRYLDYEWFMVGGNIINYDDCWCMIRDDLKEEIRSKEKKIPIDTEYRI